MPPRLSFFDTRDGELYLHMGDDWIVFRDATDVSTSIVSIPDNIPCMRFNIEFDAVNYDIIHAPSVPPVNIDEWKEIMRTEQ